MISLHDHHLIDGRAAEEDRRQKDQIEGLAFVDDEAGPAYP